MEILLSLNEIATKCTAALTVIGNPHGMDSENGLNICWLEARQLPGIEALCQTITHSKDQDFNGPIKLQTHGERVFLSQHTRSGFFLAQPAVDLVEIGKTVYIPQCDYPLVVLAEVARRSHLDQAIHIKWGSNGGSNECLCHQGRVQYNFLSPPTQATVSLSMKVTKPYKKVVNQTHPEECHIPIRNGIPVPKANWDLICHTANQLLVPNTAVSRSGAGAIIDDNI